VTLALLHVEYLTERPDGLRYTAFCDRYRAWRKHQSPVMRQVHVAGDKLFVDYAGMRPRLVDPVTGEITDVELFVAVLGASNYTYADATRTQQVAGSAVRAGFGAARATAGEQERPGEGGDHCEGIALLRSGFMTTYRPRWFRGCGKSTQPAQRRARSSCGVPPMRLARSGRRLTERNDLKGGRGCDLL
jgi:hypothetical protein